MLHTPTSIHQILRSGNVLALYQPIVSVKTRSVVGAEALCRGLDPDSGTIIPPDTLFSTAGEEGVTLELDRLCRNTALTTFLPLHTAHPEFLAFLNFDTSIIDHGVVGSERLITLTRDLEIDPHTVVIEMIESRVRDHQALQRFVETYKDYGFLIALDDVGAGYSNLNRIPLIKPDILKIDRALVRNIHREFYKQSIFAAIVDLARKIGALVVAEGIETEEEAITTLELGADLLQGYYFARPQPLHADLHRACQEEVSHLAGAFRQHMVARITSLKSRYKAIDRLVGKIVKTLGVVSQEEFERTLRAVMASHPMLECLYVLDHHGIQVTDTVCNTRSFARRATRVFRPAQRGTDHALKDYYYLLVNTALEKYTTAPYVSLASGNLCITISVSFRDAQQRRQVLCIDIKPD